MHETSIILSVGITKITIVYLPLDQLPALCKVTHRLLTRFAHNTLFNSNESFRDLTLKLQH